MIVRKLIRLLQKCPQNAKIIVLYDTAAGVMDKIEYLVYHKLENEVSISEDFDGYFIGGRRKEDENNYKIK